MSRLDIPAVYVATALQSGALDRLAVLARDGRLQLVDRTEHGPVPVLLDARAGEADGLCAEDVPALLLDLARIGLAAVKEAVGPDIRSAGDLVEREIVFMRISGLAMPRDPGAR